MKIRVAALDDQKDILYALRLHVAQYNKKTKEDIQVELDIFTDPDEFLKNYSHDLAVLDIDLGEETDLDGFDVAKLAYKIHPKGDFIMVSSSITEKDSENHDCLMPKAIASNFVSELVKRYQDMSISLKTRISNKLEVFDQAQFFSHAHAI
jgi:hypothetical protein